MTFEQQLKLLQKQFDVVEVINLDQWHDYSYEAAQSWLESELARVYRPVYDHNQRIVFVQQQGDVYVKDNSVGLIIRNLQIIANEKDVSNFFIVLLSNNPNITKELEFINSISQDPVPITGIHIDEGDFTATIVDTHPTSLKEIYQYGSANPLKINLKHLSQREQFLLTDSKKFCMYPWAHLHAWPTGQAFPCCMSEFTGQVGNSRLQTLKEIWNDTPMKQLRVNMLTEQSSPACVRCYEQEDAGFFSGRKSANKHHGHLINRVLETAPDGNLDRFEMNYWDIRFSNLCNLSCRSCGHIFSSSWYQDQAKLVGGDWKDRHQVLNYAGRTETDIWEQLIPHLDYVEQIYFAGGEPLMMAEHYNILDELERRGRFDVRLIYNTNFTHVKLKDRTVFDYWKRFTSVAVGASLDAMGPRAEYIRRGTDWATVERNRVQMMEICPQVDFYVSPTLSIMNALHIPDFHKSWVEKGYIKPQDLNVNILQDPAHFRIDIATADYKQQIKNKLEKHLEWLRPQDPLQRATVGFESAINYMMATDNTDLLPKFWAKTHELDAIRKENILEVIPELKELL
jgi:organic radical activating enzyme/virulence-associated protein VapD